MYRQGIPVQIELRHWISPPHSHANYISWYINVDWSCFALQSAKGVFNRFPSFLGWFLWVAMCRVKDCWQSQLKCPKGTPKAIGGNPFLESHSAARLTFSSHLFCGHFCPKWCMNVAIMNIRLSWYQHGISAARPNFQWMKLNNIF